MHNLYQFASTQEGESSSLFSSLGIDGRTLVFQLIAFLVLVFILKKWVFPIFVNVIEKREADIERSTKEADRLKAQAEESETKTSQALAKARKEAAQIIASARDEANLTITKAEDKAKAKSESLLSQAQEEILLEKKKAQKDLLSEVSGLVAVATEKVLGKMSNVEIDDAVIEESIREAS